MHNYREYSTFDCTGTDNKKTCCIETACENTQTDEKRFWHIRSVIIERIRILSDISLMSFISNCMKRPKETPESEFVSKMYGLHFCLEVNRMFTKKKVGHCAKYVCDHAIRRRYLKAYYRFLSCVDIQHEIYLQREF